MSKTTQEFFPQQYDNGNILSERGCEPHLSCDGNSAVFKGILTHALAFTTTIVPGEDNKIIPKLKASAKAAGQQCSGGSDGKTCGDRWYQPTWDGKSGLEQQISVLSVMTGSLVHGFQSGGGGGGGAPKSSNSGGTSQSDPNAGTGSGSGHSNGPQLKKITAGDRAGASILTIVFLVGWIGGTVWLTVI